MEPVVAKVVKCPCGNDYCGVYQLNFGTFYQGSGFEKDDAELLVRLWNIYHSKQPAMLPLSKMVQMWNIVDEAISAYARLPEGGTSTELGTILQKLDLNVLWLLMLQYSPMRDVMLAGKEERLKKYEDALKFYADEKNWGYMPYDDMSQIARKALRES